MCLLYQVQGLRLSIDLSSSTSEFISNKTIGVVTEDISRNGRLCYNKWYGQRRKYHR
jgi:hypothetical protein